MPELELSNFNAATTATTVLHHAIATAVNLMASAEAGTNGSLSSNNGTSGNGDTGYITNDPTVSRGAIFGLFLTLSFCVLSQPYGSLVYKRHCGIFWRLNPLACFMEAVVIFLILTTTVVGTLRRQRRTLFSRKLLLDLGEELHATSTALLVMRGNVDRSLDDNSMALLLEAALDEDIPDPLVSQSPTNGVDGVEPRSINPQTSTHSSGDNASTSAQTQGVEINQQSVLQMEEGIELSEPDQARPFSESRLSILHNATGSSSFIQREFRIQIVFFFAATGGVVKLCAMRSIPRSLRLAGVFMLAAWLAVQVLLLTFHSVGRIDDRKMARIVRRARNLTDPTRSRVYTLSLRVPAVLICPVLFYLCYLYSALRSDRNALELIISFPVDMLFVFIQNIPFMLVIVLGFFWPRWINRQRLLIRLVLTALNLCVRFALGILWITGACFLFTSAIEFRYYERDVISSVPSPVKHLLKPYYYFCLILCTCPIFFMAVILLFINTRAIPLYGLDEEEISVGPGIVNIIITALVFVMFLIRYEESGTHLPGWVGWFG